MPAGSFERKMGMEAMAEKVPARVESPSEMKEAVGNEQVPSRPLGATLVA